MMNSIMIQLEKIINKIFEHNLVDEIIVMNDHGPRTQIFGEIIKDEKVSLENINRIKKNLKLNSFFDKDYYGVFLARFDSNKFKNQSDKFEKNDF